MPTRKLRPSKTEIKNFFKLATIDPNKRDSYVDQQLVEQGDARYFMIRVIEYMGSALRIHERLKKSNAKGKATLLEEYTNTMRLAATAIAISVGKTHESSEPKTKERPRSNSPAKAGGNAKGSSLVSKGNARKHLPKRPT